MPPLATLEGLHGDLSRRHFLAAAAAAGLLTACGSDTTSSPAAPAAGPWTFTDEPDQVDRDGGVGMFEAGPG